MLCGGSDAAIIPIGANSLSLPLSCTALLKFKIHVSYCMCTSAGLAGFVAVRALSQRNNDPAKASRPWDCVIFLHCIEVLSIGPSLTCL